MRSIILLQPNLAHQRSIMAVVAPPKTKSNRADTDAAKEVRCLLGIIGVMRKSDVKDLELLIKALNITHKEGQHQTTRVIPVSHLLKAYNKFK